MDEKFKKNELLQTSHIIILMVYTILSVILIGESILLSWEPWAILLIFVGAATAWIIHLQQKLSDYSRIWVNSMLMMATFFFYGIHQTSTFDLAAVMMGIMILYTMTGIRGLILLCQVTFFLTFFYDLTNMYLDGVVFDSLLVTRSMLHAALILLVGWLGRIVIERWGKMILRSREEITELKDATERLNDFLANVSHEIRTPANAVIGLTELHLEKEHSKQTTMDLLSIRAAGQRISEQISDILDYSEIDRGGLKNNYEKYMISSVIQDLAVRVAPAIPDGIELIFDVNPNIPQVLISDVGKLNKILYHLVTNSLKYTIKGGVLVRVTFEKESYGINLNIIVQDTGLGMDDVEKERAFEGFYQANSSLAKIGGLGLGLPIVSGFVASLGGFLLLESQPDEGTTVRVSLPQKVADYGNCMSVKDKSSLCLGAFLHFEKFSDVSVREFYQSLMRHVIEGLDVPIHVADTKKQLEELSSSLKLTHLLVGTDEYKTNSAFLEELAKDTLVVVACAHGFFLPEGSRAVVMEKPVSSFQVTELLNVKNGDYHKTKDQIYLKDVMALVVDDEPMNLTVAKEILCRYGMVVETLPSGYEAVEACRNRDYDIVFMDHMMPGMDGIETTKQIRATSDRNRDILPIVALTANAVSTAKEMFLSEGFDGFISKPIERSELERVLKRVMPEAKVELLPPGALRAPGAGASMGTGAAGAGSAGASSGTGAGAAGAGLAGVAVGAAGTVSSDSMTGGAAGIEQAYPALSALSVDIESGIGYCGDDEAFYRTLLEQFVSESYSKKQNLIRAFEDSDAADYEIRIHALKSTSKMLGAMTLSNMARELELAASTQKVIDAGRHDEAMVKYDELVDAISSDLGISPDEVSGEPEPESDDTVFEFAPDDVDTAGREQKADAKDAVFEFAPDKPDADDSVFEFVPEGNTK